MLLPALALAACMDIAPDARPQLSGPEEIHLSPDGLLRVHYTRSGADALALPEALDWVDEGAARMVAAYVGQDGWPAPPPDEGRGGDDRLDVYLRDLSSNGCTHEQTLPSGARASYVEIAPARAGIGKTIFESIVGHELHHVLEFAISQRGTAAWIAEASATYAQYTIFDDGTTEFLRNVLWRQRLTAPQRRLDDLGDDTDLYEYAGMVWVKYLIDRGGGDRKILRELWEDMDAAGSWQAGHEALVRARLGLASLDEAVADYAVWNWFACGNDDGMHYDPATAACTFGGLVTAAGAAVPEAGTSVQVGARGSAYVVLAPDCATGQLAVALTTPGRMRFQLVGADVVDDGDGATPLVAPGWNAEPAVVLIGTNVGAAATTFSWDARASGAYVGPAPATVTVAPGELRLVAGDAAMLGASAKYARCAAARDAGADWRSTDESVATVAAGRVEARAPGTAEVYALVQGVMSQRVKIVVAAAPGSGACGVANGRTIGAIFPVLLLAMCILLKFLMF